MFNVKSIIFNLQIRFGIFLQSLPNKIINTITFAHFNGIYRENTHRKKTEK